MAASGALAGAPVLAKDQQFIDRKMVYRGGCGSCWTMSAHPLL